MAFGQQSGPSASASQVRELLGLLQDAGHTDFRDARGAMGFSQRQAAGKFTRDEASAYIDQLLDAQHRGTEPIPPPASRPTPSAPATRQAPADRALRAVPAEELAAELQRRGWVVMEP